MTEPRTERSRVRRHPERGRYELEAIHAILDEALLCHLGTVVDGRPHVVPTLHARDGETVYVHGAPANRALTALRGGSEACLVVTLLDGLVMARSAFHHSMNYRSVVVIGPASEVTDREQKLAAMKALVEHVARGRWEEVRQPSETELQSTVILALSLDECSAKIRTGDPIDDETDLGGGTWAGVIPLALRAGAPLTAADVEPGVEVPPSVRDYRLPKGGASDAWGHS
ncbi:MAG: pyridoxamine 5'-phosphate oxidase family protein [Candidatus Dormibacteria bacterium]